MALLLIFREPLGIQIHSKIERQQYRWLIVARRQTVLDQNNPNGDIEIQFSGLRPGEKLYEELLIGNNVYETEHQLILRSNEDMLSWQDLEIILKKLKSAIEVNDLQLARKLILKVVPGYKPHDSILDLMFSSQ